MSTIEISIAASFIAVAYAVVIAGESIPGLRYGYSWLERWRDAGGWRSLLVSPIGGCEKCTAGQIALWSSVAIRGTACYEDAMNHIAAASIAILLTPFLAHAYRWMQRRI